MSVAGEDAFWTFSCASYGRPGVSAACLRLQDRLGADVNMLFFCLWWSVAGAPALDDARFAVILQQARDWQDAVVRPLRTARRAAKRHSGWGTEDAEAFYRRVQATELEGERREQALIIAAACAQAAGLPAPRDPVEARLGSHLAHYLAALGIPLRPEDRADLAAIVAASGPDLPAAAIVEAACQGLDASARSSCMFTL